MECNMTVFQTAVNQAISILQLQNMTGHILKWVRRNIRGAFWLNEESRKKDYCNENFEFPLWFIHFIIFNFNILNSSTPIQPIYSSLLTIQIFFFPWKSLLKVGCVSNSKYCGTIMISHQWFTLLLLLKILLDLQKLNKLLTNCFNDNGKMISVFCG
jgi:hypothetical protein